MFGRRNKIDRTLRERGVPPQVDSDVDAEDITTAGPFDIADAPQDLEDYLDFGALKIHLTPDFEVRLEMSQAGELSGVSLLRDGSIMQLGVFAAPRSGGAWETIRDDIIAEIERNGGSVQQADGEFGPALLATLQTPGGEQLARFIGIDGPRWFLRALIAGPVAHDEQACAPFFGVFRATVVERGSEPKPVREPITLRLPQALVEQVQQAAAAAQQQSAPAGGGDD